MLRFSSWWKLTLQSQTEGPPLWCRAPRAPRWGPSQRLGSSQGPSWVSLLDLGRSWIQLRCQLQELPSREGYLSRRSGWLKKACQRLRFEQLMCAKSWRQSYPRDAVRKALPCKVAYHSTAHHLPLDKETWLDRKELEGAGDACQVLPTALLQAVLRHQGQAPDPGCTLSHPYICEVAEAAAKEGPGCSHLLPANWCLVFAQRVSLVVLLASSNTVDRCFAVDQIVKLRAGEEFGDNSVRPRRTPKLNLSATSLLNLIDWNTADVQEPSFTCTIATSEILSFKASPYNPPKFSCHTQSTERWHHISLEQDWMLNCYHSRAVKNVTTAAANVCGQDARDGFVRAQMEHREELKAFRSKQDIVSK